MDQPLRRLGRRTPRRGPGQTATELPDTHSEQAPVTTHLVFRQTWPMVVASSLSLIPFTIFSTLLIEIAADSDRPASLVGGLRGLGGVAAVIAGLGIVPLLDKFDPNRISALGLLVLAASSVVGAIGGMWPLIAFCLITGFATSLLTPSLTASAASCFRDREGSSQAATMVTSAMSLTAMLAAPLVGLPALLWGWRGDFLACTVACIALAYILTNRPTGHAPSRGTRLSYKKTVLNVARAPGAVPLILTSFFRTTAFMGYVSYAAFVYHQRFHIGSPEFTIIWTLSGASYFLANFLAGRYVSTQQTGPRIRTVLWLLRGGLIVAIAGTLTMHAAQYFYLAIAATVILAAGHATVHACLISLLVGQLREVRGAALSLNGVGVGLALFVGASTGALGLKFGGIPGLGIALSIPLLIGVALTLHMNFYNHNRPNGGDKT